MVETLTTVARSLIIFAFFVAPLLVYLFARRGAAPERVAGVAPVAALCVALVSALAVLGVMHFSRHWPEATQVVWTGVEADARSFSIGGPREGALVGWPNGSFTPKLRAASAAPGVASLEVSGGGAYVYDEKREAFSGGATLVAGGGARTVDGYGVRLTTDLRARLGNVLAAVVEVVGPKGGVEASFDLPPHNPDRHRVLPLRALVEAGGAAKEEDAERLMRVGRWAADKRLLLARSGETRLLGAESYTVECRLPCRLSIYWVGQRLPVHVSGSGARIGLMFRPPWRVASPLPPAAEGGERSLTLTATPRPGDVAFLLPLGHLVRDHRPALDFGTDADGLPVFKGPEATVGKAPPPDYLPAGQERQPDPEEFAHGETSRNPVRFGDAILHFATVNDLPRPSYIALLVGLALAAFAAGLLLSPPCSPDLVTRWVVCGLAACLWNLLAFRLLLALRFALDPSRLDDLTVKGVTLALAGLAVAPGLFLYWARLRADLDARLREMTGGRAAARRASPGFARSVAHLLALAAAFALEYSLTPLLWKNQPASPGLRLAAPFALIFVYLFFVTAAVHKSYVPGLRRALRLLLIAPLRFDAALARRSKTLWAQLAHEPPKGHVRPMIWGLAAACVATGLFVAARLQPAVGFFGKSATLAALALAALALLWVLTRLAHRALGRLIAAAVVFAAAPFAARALPGSVREIAQEVLALFAFALVPAVFWLSIRLARTRAADRIPWRRLTLLALTTVVLPAFVMPKFLGDMGSAFAAIPLFATAAVVLCLTPAWRAGAVVLCAIIGGVLLAAVTYRYFSSWLPGAAEVRLISYWQGSEIERLIPWARATRGGEGLSLQSLRDAYQHGWESRAIAHEGGWWGAGYGNAPAHLSQVRQDTIQFDSLYSFFVAGEHGVVGGVSLLLLFAAPLAAVARGAWRTRADFGYASAALVCAWLLLEALLHAGMSVGTFPFTGRGMPAVNVNSTSDLLRWLLLFCFAAQLLHWRDPSGDGARTREETASIITDTPAAMPSTARPAPARDEGAGEDTGPLPPRQAGP
ncbi:MAG TPA: FtsW/RodA/SpoVE family cell cycle protein, partial [Pyrinomonadaceae bacterium]